MFEPWINSYPKYDKKIGGTLIILSLWALISLTPIQTDSNDTPELTINSPELYITAQRDFRTELLTDKTISCLIKYESGGDPNAVGDRGLARNILQFHKATFDLYAKKYGVEYLTYDDAESQIYLAALMLEDGLGYHWSTYGKCKNKISI